MSLASVTQLADYLHETPWAVGSAEQRRAQQALDIASAIVRSRTGQRFEAGTYTVRLTATDEQWLTLPQRDVSAVSAVTLDGTAVTDYTLVGNRLFRYSGWRTDGYGPPLVDVTFTTTGQVPDDVLGAVLAVAADIYENPRGLASETIGDYTWRGSESERGSVADARLAEVARAYRRRPTSVRIA